MTNELANRNESYVARYNTGDPYARFASEGGPGIQGKLLQCKKGDWSIGQDDTGVPEGARFLVVIPSMMRGWMQWRGGVVTAAEMGLVADDFVVPHRYSLGDLDEEQWEKLPDGKPRDPWAQSYRVLMIEVSPPHGDVTFAGSSYGTALACKELCRIYSLEAAQHPDAYPVVTLSAHTRPNKKWGPIKGPWFEVQGWATVEDVKAGRKAAKPAAKKPAKSTAKSAAKSAAKAETVAAELDDEVPDWGNAAA